MTDALELVIDAALERALLADDARRHFALAGALERSRSADGSDGVGAPHHDHGEPERRELSGRPPDTVGYRHVTDFDTPGCGKSSRRYSQQYDALGAALLSTVAVGAFETAGATDIDPGAWSPDSRDGGPHAELVAAGAAAACRRFDIDLATAATRSGLSAERLARYRVDADAAPGPE